MTLDPAPVLPDPGPGDDGPGDDGPADDGPGDERSRVRAVARAQWSRRRDLERQLHDGAALRISALALRLGLLRHGLPGGEREFQDAVEGLQDELHVVLQELRDVAGRLYPPLLDEAGLGPALREVAGRSAVPVRIDAPDERFGPAVEGAAYFALLGCLPVPPEQGETADGPAADATNGSPNGTTGCGQERPGASIGVVVRRDGDILELLVSGVDACHAGTLHDGVRLLGGTVSLGDPASGEAAVPGGPAITVRIPCA